MVRSVQHLAVIMDGNGRWAKARNLPRSAGHKAGLEAAREVIRGCEPHRISHLTLFAFSSENWRRPQGEVRLLLDLFVNTINRELDELAEKGIRLKFIGDTGAFEPRLRKSIERAEAQTEENDTLRLNIAVNYGGRWDIAQAAQQVARQVRDGRIEPEQIDTELFAGHLSLAGQPEPDLLIRTGGESRISNFLVWQLAYSELYFCDCLWPDFDPDQLQRAIDWFSGRQRRFGRTPEQASSPEKPGYA